MILGLLTSWKEISPQSFLFPACYYDPKGNPTNIKACFLRVREIISQPVQIPCCRCQCYRVRSSLMSKLSRWLCWICKQRWQTMQCWPCQLQLSVEIQCQSLLRKWLEVITPWRTPDNFSNASSSGNKGEEQVGALIVILPFSLSASTA